MSISPYFDLFSLNNKKLKIKKNKSKEKTVEQNIFIYFVNSLKKRDFIISLFWYAQQACCLAYLKRFHSGYILPTLHIFVKLLDNVVVEIFLYRKIRVNFIILEEKIK